MSEMPEELLIHKVEYENGHIEWGVHSDLNVRALYDTKYIRADTVEALKHDINSLVEANTALLNGEEFSKILAENKRLRDAKPPCGKCDGTGMVHQLSGPGFKCTVCDG